MDRRAFLKRFGLVAGAAAVVDPAAMLAAPEPPLTATRVAYQESLKTAYAPVTRWAESDHAWDAQRYNDEFLSRFTKEMAEAMAKEADSVCFAALRGEVL